MCSFYDTPAIEKHFKYTYQQIKEFKAGFERLNSFHSGICFTDNLVLEVDVHSSIKTSRGLPVDQEDLVWKCHQVSKKDQWNGLKLLPIHDTNPLFSPSTAKYRTFFKIKPDLEAVVVDSVSKAVFWFKRDKGELLSGFSLYAVFAVQYKNWAELNDKTISHGFGENYLCIESFCRANIPRKNAELGRLADYDCENASVYDDEKFDGPEDESPDAVEKRMREVVDNPTVAGMIRALITEMKDQVGYMGKEFFMFCWFLGDNNWESYYGGLEAVELEVIRDAVRTMNIIRKFSQGINIPRIIDEVFDPKPTEIDLLRSQIRQMQEVSRIMKGILNKVTAGNNLYFGN